MEHLTTLITKALDRALQLYGSDGLWERGTKEMPEYDEIYYALKQMAQAGQEDEIKRVLLAVSLHHHMGEHIGTCFLEDLEFKDNISLFHLFDS